MKEKYFEIILGKEKLQNYRNWGLQILWKKRLFYLFTPWIVIGRFWRYIK